MDELTEEQYDLLNERTLIIKAFKVGAERKFGFCSDVRKIELKEYSENIWKMIAQQNWINTEKPN